MAPDLSSRAERKCFGQAKHAEVIEPLSFPFAPTTSLVRTGFLRAEAGPDLSRPLATCPKQSGIDLYRDAVAVKSISNSLWGARVFGSNCFRGRISMSDLTQTTTPEQHRWPRPAYDPDLNPQPEGFQFSENCPPA